MANTPSNVPQALLLKVNNMRAAINALHSSAATKIKRPSRNSALLDEPEVDQFWTNANNITDHKHDRFIRSNKPAIIPSSEPHSPIPFLPTSSPPIDPLTPFGVSKLNPPAPKPRHRRSRSEPIIRSFLIADSHLINSTDVRADVIDDVSRPSSSQSIDSISSSSSTGSTHADQRSMHHYPPVRHCHAVSRYRVNLPRFRFGTLLACPYSFFDIFSLHGGFLVSAFALSLKSVALFAASLHGLLIQVWIELPDRIRAVDLWLSVTFDSVLATSQSIAYSLMTVLHPACRDSLYASLCHLLNNCVMKHSILVHQYRYQSACQDLPYNYL